MTQFFLVSDALRLPVYHQEHTISTYLYQDNLPDLPELTFCFWFSAGYFTSGDLHLFSFSTPLSCKLCVFTSHYVYVTCSVVISQWSCGVVVGGSNRSKGKVLFI